MRDGQPFVLGADGSYDPALNRFFRELDSWGVRAANSVAAYARDVMLFCRFLHESRGGKAIWDCEEADLRAYKQLRLNGPTHLRVSVATWRRFIAALDKWVAWALSEGLLQREPFSYRDKSVWTPVGARRVRINAASEPAPGPAPIRFLAYSDYLTWRDIGLGGRCPDGRADPHWRGQHGARDRAFADLLVSTGMRLGEAASLLVPELPNRGHSHGGVLEGIHLASAVTKRGHPRTVFPPPRVTAALRRYVSIERDALVTANCAAGGYRVGAEDIVVHQAGPRSLTFSDGSSASYPASTHQAGRDWCWSAPAGRSPARSRCGWTGTGNRSAPQAGSRCSDGPMPAVPWQGRTSPSRRMSFDTSSRCTCSACCCVKASPRSERSLAGRSPLPS